MARPLPLSIQDHLIPWRSLPWPLSWPDIFRREAPLELEIGFGNGEFLRWSAGERPGVDHVGIEVSWAGATRLFKRLDADGLTNARALVAEAEVALTHLFEPGILAAVVVNHPCPWPKARHISRRLLQPSFLALLASRMAPGAPLTVVTDHAEYAAWLTEILEGQAWFRSRHGTTTVPSIPGRPTTKYQEKAMAQGIPIHFFEWEKVHDPDLPPPTPLDPERHMPTMTLSGPLDGEHPFEGFEPLSHHETHRGVETVVRLTSVYRRETVPPRTWLVEALVQEGALRQEFALLVAERRSGDLLVKPSQLGRPHPTHGVKRAIHLVGTWLRERHPGLELESQNLGIDPA